METTFLGHIRCVEKCSFDSQRDGTDPSQLQAHPDLIADPNHNGIYLTYTKNDKVNDGAVYTTPLYYAEWE